MIWAQDTISSEIEIIGEFKDRIAYIYIEKNGSKHMLFEKIGIGLAYEEPTKEEVRNKFIDKFMKLTKTIKGKPEAYFQTLAFND